MRAQTGKACASVTGGGGAGTRRRSAIPGNATAPRGRRDHGRYCSHPDRSRAVYARQPKSACIHNSSSLTQLGYNGSCFSPKRPIQKRAAQQRQPDGS
jgi:hypothetical protein